MGEIGGFFRLLAYIVACIEAQFFLGQASTSRHSRFHHISLSTPLYPPLSLSNGFAARGPEPCTGFAQSCCVDEVGWAAEEEVCYSCQSGSHD